jgi:hypothetical protein
MSVSKPELDLSIVPLKNSDHKRVTCHKSNPLQGIKDSDNTTLLTISCYIKRIAAAEFDGTPIYLYANYPNEPLQIPLSLSVREYLIVTNQVAIGEVPYSFSSVKHESDVPTPPVGVQPEDIPSQPLPEARIEVPISNTLKYPPPSFGKFGDVSYESLFHSRFSIFSNSLRTFSSSSNDLNAAHHNGEMRGNPEETISLRENLEMEILRK